MTWPLATHLRSHLPIGNLDSATLPYFNLWTLEWNADRLQHGWRGYWDAPIFHPEPHTFALSEPQAFTGSVFALLAALAGPVAGYDLTLLLFLVLNGIAARHLLRSADVSPSAATAGGMLAIALPFALKELGVLQLTALFPVLLALAELCSLFRAPSRAALLRLALWFALALWTCLYYALFLTLFIALAACVLVRRSVLRAPLLAGAAAALVIVATAAAPIATVQHAAVARFQRSPATVRSGSALARSYATLAPRALGSRVLRVTGRRGRALAPGVVLCALAFAGLLTARRGPWRRWVLFCSTCALLAALFSFGTRLRVFGVCPYELLLQRHWPGFSQLRSPYRLAAFAQIFLLVPAGFGLDRILHAWQRTRGAAIASAVLTATVALAWLEVVPLGQDLARFPSEALQEPWVMWLRQHPDGAVAMVPPEASGKARDFEPIALAMLQGLRHGHALINGYSGFFPPRSATLTHSLRRFPEASVVAALQRAGVRYVVCTRAFVAQHSRSFADAAPHLYAVHSDAHRIIYQFDPIRAASASATR